MAEIYDEEIELERFDALILRGVALGVKSSRKLSRLLNIEEDAIRAKIVALIEAGYVNGYTFKLTERGANALDQATLEKVSAAKMEPKSILGPSWIGESIDYLINGITHGFAFCVGAGIVVGAVVGFIILALGFIF